MAKCNLPNDMGNLLSIDLVFLSADQIRLIDRALSEVGEFGEVRLLKVKGKLRFIQKITSEEVGNNHDEAGR